MNNFSISTDELSSSLQRSAGTLATLGSTLEQTAALTVAANSILQDPESVAAGLRTIQLRLVGTEESKEQLSALGESVDDFIVQTESKLRESIMNLTKVASNNFEGFDILDENGNYKDFYDIMLGLSEIYEEIQEQDEKFGNNAATALIELIAGKNRSSVAASILSNPELLSEAYESALNSDGSAEKELQAYLDSIEGRISNLTNEIQRFWHTAINTDVVKDVIDFLTDLVSLGTELVDTLGLVPTLIGAIGGGISIKKGGGRAKNIYGIKEVNYHRRFNLFWRLIKIKNTKYKF